MIKILGFRKGLFLKPIDLKDSIIVTFKLSGQNLQTIIARFDKYRYLDFINGHLFGTIYEQDVKMLWEKNLGTWVKQSLEIYEKYVGSEDKKFFISKSFWQCLKGKMMDIRSWRSRRKKLSLKDVDHNDKIEVAFNLAGESFEVAIARFDNATYLVFVNGVLVNRLFSWVVRNWEKELGMWVKSAIEAYKSSLRFLTERKERK